MGGCEVRLWRSEYTTRSRSSANTIDEILPCDHADWFERWKYQLNLEIRSFLGEYLIWWPFCIFLVVRCQYNTYSPPCSFFLYFLSSVLVRIMLTLTTVFLLKDLRHPWEESVVGLCWINKWFTNIHGRKGRWIQEETNGTSLSAENLDSLPHSMFESASPLTSIVPSLPLIPVPLSPYRMLLIKVQAWRVPEASSQGRSSDPLPRCKQHNCILARVRGDSHAQSSLRDSDLKTWSDACCGVVSVSHESWSP